MRSCEKIGPAEGSSTTIAIAVASITGDSTTSASADKTTSCVRRPTQYNRCSRRFCFGRWRPASQFQPHLLTFRIPHLRFDVLLCLTAHLCLPKLLDYRINGAFRAWRPPELLWTHLKYLFSGILTKGISDSMCHSINAFEIALSFFIFQFHTTSIDSCTHSAKVKPFSLRFHSIFIVFLSFFLSEPQPLPIFILWFIPRPILS